MIEVDPFWVLALGGQFAAFAANQLKKSDRQQPWYRSDAYVYALHFFSLIFAPLGLHLVWNHPGWESMFFFRVREDYHDFLPVVCVATNVLLGSVGFFIGYRCVAKGRDALAHVVWTTNYVIFSGILGFGYARFLYGGTGPEFGKVHYDLKQFFDAPIFRTLAVMAMIMFPFLVFGIRRSYRAGEHDVAQKSLAINTFVKTALAEVALGCVGYVLFLNFYSADPKYYVHGSFGPYAPMVGFLTAEAIVLSLNLVLLVTLPLAPRAAVDGHRDKKTR